jgi:hypothetical protein
VYGQETRKRSVKGRGKAREGIAPATEPTEELLDPSREEAIEPAAEEKAEHEPAKSAPAGKAPPAKRATRKKME